MKRPSGRLLAIVVVVVVFGILGWGVLAFKNSDRARNIRANQGTPFYGFRDVHFGLSGTVVTTPITDWSFTDAFPLVQIETRPWYLIPYTVTINFARDDDQLYVYSSYNPPMPGKPDLRDRFPEGRAWNRHLVRDPRLRLKIGDQIFNCLAVHVTDPAGSTERAQKAFARKFPGGGAANQSVPPEQRSKQHFFHLIPQWG